MHMQANTHTQHWNSKTNASNTTDIPRVRYANVICEQWGQVIIIVDVLFQRTINKPNIWPTKTTNQSRKNQTHVHSSYRHTHTHPWTHSNSITDCKSRWPTKACSGIHCHMNLWLQGRRTHKPVHSCAQHQCRMSSALPSMLSIYGNRK